MRTVGYLDTRPLRHWRATADDSPVPLYDQVAAILRGWIASGKVTGRLPSLRTIARAFEVSHITAEHAVKILRDEGLVVTVTGKGTYIVGAPASC
jgi:DNA-binding GntR family transcriptional regulator